MSMFIVQYDTGRYIDKMEILAKTSTSARRIFTRYANKIGADYKIVNIIKKEGRI